MWAFFGRVDDVAACLPGASLDGGERDGRVDGKIRVKAGPIFVELSGVAQITRDETMHRGVIVGSGRDARSNSATRGMINYSVKPDEGGGSRIDVDVGYALTGMLAQFSRTGPGAGSGEPPDGGFRRKTSRRAFLPVPVATPPVVR